MRRHIRVALFCVLSAALAVTAACGDDDDEEPGATTPAETATEEPTATATEGSPTEEPFGGARTPVTASPVPGLTAALLQIIRSEEQGSFDRITFEFDGGGVPGYDVRFVEPPIAYDPSGETMEIDGEAFIVVRMEPAAGHDPDTGDETYSGALELKPALPSIQEVERVGDFEGVLSWALGLGAEEDFRVSTLEDPPRLVIDVAHP